MKSKRKFRFALAAVFLVGTSFGSWGQDQHRFTLTLNPSQLRATSGSEIRLRITVANTSGSPSLWGNLDLDGMHAEDNYPPGEITVLNSGGKRAPLTAFAQLWTHSVLTGGGGVFPTIPPGGSITETLVLSKLFDLTVPGTYTVRVSTGGVTSNWATITILG